MSDRPKSNARPMQHEGVVKRDAGRAGSRERPFLGRRVAVLVLVGALACGCAARKSMQRQAVAIAAASEDLDDDLSRLEGALETVHHLRRVRIEGDRLAAARAARETEMMLGAWRLESDTLAHKKLEVFEGVRATSEAAAGHAYGVIDYKLGVERPLHVEVLDRAALHRLVALLLRLAKPSHAVGEVGFFVDYAIAVGDGAKQGVEQVVNMAKPAAPPPPESAAESESESESDRSPQP